MKVFTENKSIQTFIAQLKTKGNTVGMVPTMGALHYGHMSLVNRAFKENDWIVVSIFVNPTQFNNLEDLKNYPRTLERDKELLKSQSENILIYAPSIEDIYQGNTKSQHFDFDGLESEMEGMFREGHFDGVGTVVKRLLEIVKPDNAYFGEKDFQQLMIIKKLVEKYNIPVNIVGCKIYREDNGLAMSSRNERLKLAYKNEAPFIYKTLMKAKKMFKTESANSTKKWVENQFLNNKLLKLEYFVIADIETLKMVKRKSSQNKYRAFIAVYADDVRLIDNIALN
ncbi:pantoate--beta-alanine ligase [Yeosuana sp. MJ-SS3]|uniref:Pantothenate synthetase n=1 Tax=Gilvirhabdus luticola TaxID=3079858 RepID=A0ABU3U3B9_9FLAO|nr:pantoate--beta-alanine ligase [Yeosuana sp. MJ-SS3]MDU8884832.1 pantoate--beta-alanine ligase [Yeosuana sp. MJ-SS3]